VVLTLATLQAERLAAPLPQAAPRKLVLPVAQIG